MNPAELMPLAARQSGPLQGRARVPGDKSISHRALILAALTVGETTINGLLEGEDVLHTADAMRALGARVERTGDCAWRVHGVGVGGFAQPAGVLDFANSGTGVPIGDRRGGGRSGDSHLRWRRIVAWPADAARARSIGKDGCARGSKSPTTGDCR